MARMVERIPVVQFLPIRQSIYNEIRSEAIGRDLIARSFHHLDSREVSSLCQMGDQRGGPSRLSTFSVLIAGSHFLAGCSDRRV